VTSWRLAVGLVLLLALGLPLALPVSTLLGDPAAWENWSEYERILSLAGNSGILAAGTIILAVPSGMVIAILLYRTDLPLRRGLRFLTLLALLVPLPLFASGWQAVLGSGGWWHNTFWNPPRSPDTSFASGGQSWTPWGQGMGSAIWVHAMAGLPWVILLVGQGLCWVERQLEEDALTAAGPWRVLWHVTLPRSGAAIGAAAVWLLLQCATEITITDLMQVRTFAEEVYTQAVAPDLSSRATGDLIAEIEARALAVSVPPALATALLVWFMARRWERRLPAGTGGLQPQHVFTLGWWRWPVGLSTALLLVLFTVLPLVSLVWRAGLHGTPRVWTLQTVWDHLALVARADWRDLADTLLLAVMAGLLTTGLALVVCWVARDAPRFRTALLVLMALAWALPGPVLGLGLKGVINLLVDTTTSDRLVKLLYQGPSPLPVLWVDLLRFFPFAMALLWPVVRLLPREICEAARVDGARPGQELVQVVWPLTAWASLRTALAVGVLCLGEVSASKLVCTPGQVPFAVSVFTQMHYGVTNDLAARCLLLLIVVGAGAGLFLVRREVR
jgi:iron(III) transport system permease protein